MSEEVDPSNTGPRLSVDHLYRVAAEAIDDQADLLRETSEQLWLNPEVGKAENFAHSLLTERLEKAGFSVTRHYTCSTAFRASICHGSRGPHVAVLCEYDALPSIGHACGHNLIAEAGLAAGLGLKAALESSTDLSGSLTVFGTPDEEGDGGKVCLIQHDCFDDVDVALMVHPDRRTFLKPVVLAMNEVTVTFHGRAAHAAAAPWDGTNALDAAVSAYTSLSMLRQQILPSCRLHATITEGGVKPNIIPERAVLVVYARALTINELSSLKKQLCAIFESAASCTGCQVDVKWSYSEETETRDMIHNSTLVECFAKHLRNLGEVETVDEDAAKDAISTDMGNTSYVVPSIHPMINIDTHAPLHTPDFKVAANTSAAHSAILRAAKAVSMCGIDVWTDGSLLAAAKKEFTESTNA